MIAETTNWNLNMTYLTFFIRVLGKVITMRFLMTSEV